MRVVLPTRPPVAEIARQVLNSYRIINMLAELYCQGV